MKRIVASFLYPLASTAHVRTCTHSIRCVSRSGCLYEYKKVMPSDVKAKTNGQDSDKATQSDEAAAATPSPEAYRALLHDLLLYRRETMVPVVAALQKERKLLDKRLEELDQKVEQLSLIREEIRSLVSQHKLEEQIELQKVLHKISSMEEKKLGTAVPKSRSHDTQLKAATPRPPRRPVQAVPSPQDVHNVVQRALMDASWQRAVALLLGAVQLGSIPLAETYEAVLLSAVRNGGWASVRALVKELGTTLRSQRALYHTVVDMMLLVYRDNEHKLGEEVIPFVSAMGGEGMTLEHRQRLILWSSCLHHNKTASMLQLCEQLHLVRGSSDVDERERELILTAAATEGHWHVAHHMALPSRESTPQALVLYLQSFTSGVRREGVWGIPWKEAVAHVRSIHRTSSTVPSEVTDAMEELAAVVEREGRQTREEIASTKQRLRQLGRLVVSSPPAAVDIVAAVTIPQASEMLQLIGDDRSHVADSSSPESSFAACRNMEVALALWQQYPALLVLEQLQRVLGAPLSRLRFPDAWHVVDGQYRGEPLWRYVVDRILSFPNVDKSGKVLHRHRADHALVLLHYLSSFSNSSGTAEAAREEDSCGQELPLRAAKERIVQRYVSMLEEGALDRYSDALRLLRSVLQTASVAMCEDEAKEVLSFAVRMNGSYLPTNVVLKTVCEEAVRRSNASSSSFRLWEIALSFYWQNRNHSAVLSPILEASLRTSGAWEATIQYANQCIVEYGDVRVLADVAAPILAACGRTEELVALMAPHAAQLTVKDISFLRTCKDQLAVRKLAKAVETDDVTFLWSLWTALRPHFGEETRGVRKAILEELPEEKREQIAIALISSKMHTECCTFLHDCLRLKVFSRRWTWKALLMYRTICMMGKEELDSIPSKLRTLTSSVESSLMPVTNALVYGLAAVALVSRGYHVKAFDLFLCYVALGAKGGTASISEQQLWERMPVLTASVAPVLSHMAEPFSSLRGEAREAKKKEMQSVFRYFLPALPLHSKPWSSMMGTWATASLLAVELLLEAILSLTAAERAVPSDLICCIALFPTKALQTLTAEDWKLLGDVLLQSSAVVGAGVLSSKGRQAVTVICEGLAHAGLSREALLCLEKSVVGPTGAFVSRTLAEAALRYVTAVERQQQQKQLTAHLEKSPLFSPCVAEGEVRHLLQQLLDLGDWESVCSVWQRLVKGQLRLFVAPSHGGAIGVSTSPSSASAIDMAFVLQLLHDVGAVAPWARVVQLWRELLETVPYANWEPHEEAIGNAFAVLMASMRSQGVEINDMCNCVRFLVVQFGLRVPAKVYEELMCFIAREDGNTRVTEAELHYVSDELVVLRAKLGEMKVRQIIHALDQWVTSSVGSRARVHSSAPPSSSPEEQALPSLFFEGRYPSLTGDQLSALAAWAPLIIVGSVRQLEQISQQHFGGRVRPYELKPLLYHHAAEVKTRVGAPSAALKPLQAECLRYLAVHTPFHVLLSECYCGTSHALTNEEVDAYVRVQCFDNFVTAETAVHLRVSCRDAAVALAACRWTIVEEELREAVWRHNGKLPKKLLTSPHTTSKEIIFYWNVFHRIILPELDLDPSDLCVVSAVVPQLAAMRAQPQQVLPPKERERHLWEIAANARLSFFAHRSTPTTKAILVVGHLAWKSLQKLHKQLTQDAEAPPAMPLLYDTDVMRSGSLRRRPCSRTVVAARIAQHMERAEHTLTQRALACVVTCARLDRAERPTLTGGDEMEYVQAVWKDMGLTTPLSIPAECVAAVGSAPNSTRDTVEHIHCVLLRTLTRIALSHASGEQSIPEAVSEALMVRVKQTAQGDRRARADVMCVWKALSISGSLKCTDAVHATALQRVVMPSAASLMAFRKMKTAQTKSRN